MAGEEEAVLSSAPHADRLAALKWAADLIRRPDWVLLDTETTGYGRADQVVQIGVVSPSGETLLDTLVRPSVPIPAEVVRIHGITEAVVQDAPAFPEVLRALQTVVSGRQIVAYNAEFDRRLLEQSARAFGVSLPACAWVCAMLEYSRYVGEPSQRGPGYRWQKLPRGAAAEALHGAVGDCLLTLELIRTMAYSAPRALHEPR